MDDNNSTDIPLLVLACLEVEGNVHHDKAPEPHGTEEDAGEDLPVDGRMYYAIQLLPPLNRGAVG